MQLDMHYYGTYAMARSAGITEDAAKIIATCAQFVDDNVADTDLEFEDGSRIDSEATAHHAADVENLDLHDQRQVWVPFHFLPGKEGNGYTERLKCRKDSPIAQEMRDHHIGLAGQQYDLALMGITAHVYADTFSHYGFSGVGSRGNKIDNDSFKFHEEVEGIGGESSTLDADMREHLRQKISQVAEREKEREDQGLVQNIKSWWDAGTNVFVSIAGEKLSGALGHGAVSTFPDRPYLVWSFEYENDDYVIGGKLSVRNNPETFLEGCRALHAMFADFGAARGTGYNAADARNFDNIADAVFDILTTQGSKEERIARWQQAANEGVIFGTAGNSIPEYEGEGWNEQWRSFDKSENTEQVAQSNIWRFYQAAAIHRTYVLRDLLPKHDLVVD